MDPIENNDNIANISKNDQASDKKNTRGRTQLSDLVQCRSDGDRMEVAYNRKGQPCGKAGIKLSSFIGLQARTTVPISLDNWREKAFIVDPKSRKNVESSAGKAWRTFKSTLTTDYVLKFKDEPEILKRPPVSYDFILQKHWDEFVTARLKPEFQLIRQEQSKRQSFHQYNHRLSRKGYARLEDEIKLASGITTDIDRSILWKKGRVDKEGNYLTHTIKERVEKIDAVTKSIEEGTISTSGSNDILTMAMETPEHSGRVRAVGQFFTPKVYFNTPRCKAKLVDQEMLQKQLEQQTLQLEEMQKQLNMFTSILQPNQLSMLQALAQTSLTSEKASCSIKKVSNETVSTEEISNMEIKKDKDKSIGEVMKGKDDDMETFVKKPKDIKKVKQCKLAIENIENIVACGTIITLDGPVHGVPLGVKNLRVAVDVAIKEDAFLPIPIRDEILTIKQAIGTHVAWPRHLVLSNDEHPKKPPGMSTTQEVTQDLYKMPSSVHLLLRLAKGTMEKDVPTKIPIESCVFGNEFNTFLFRDDIIQFCSMHEISNVCIAIYMRQLWFTLKKRNQDNLYIFVDPGRISHLSGKFEERSSALLLRLQNAKQDQLVIAPYNKGGHWMLAVIDPYSELVYYLDPLNECKIDGGMKSVIDLALKMFNAHKGRKGRKSVVWKVVKCPCQVGNVECGYYVMKYMKEIIEDPTSPIIHKFNGKVTYTQEEIDMVRIDWAELVDTFIQDDVE